MRKTILALVTTLASACSDSSGPPSPVPSSQLHFLVQGATAPALLATSDSFYARMGVDRKLQLFYQGAAPGDTGEAFLTFEVKADGLSKHPDGSPFQPNDSILISVSVVDPDSFAFTFAPTGLQFNAASPARLKIEYDHSDHDFNGDGKIDAQDDAAESKFSLWRREPPDTLWTKIGSLENEGLDEIEADILSFTQYAVAW